MLDLTKEEIEMILGSLRVRQGMCKNEKSRFEAFHETQYEGYTTACREIEKYENLIEKLSKEVEQWIN